MPKVKALFVCGSFNQTTQMQRIAEALPDEHFDKWFAAAYANGVIERCRRWGLVEWTILGYRLSARGMEHLEQSGAKLDDRGRSRSYDLVFLCQTSSSPATSAPAKQRARSWCWCRKA